MHKQDHGETTEKFLGSLKPRNFQILIKQNRFLIS